MVKSFEQRKREFFDKGLRLYRQELKEELGALKRLVEGMAIVGKTPELVEDYQRRAWRCRSFKRLIKICQI